MSIYGLFWRLACIAGALALCLSGGVAESASSCPDLLEVTTTDGASNERLSLSFCDVKGRFEPTTDGVEQTRLVLEFAPAAAGRFRTALEDGGRLAEALAAERLAVGGVAPSVPNAPLLPTSSARREEQSAWLWDKVNGRLSIALVAANATPSEVVACQVSGSGTPLLWFGTREVRPGTIVTPAIVMSPRPGSFSPVAPECVGGWSLSARAPAVVHPLLGLVIVAEDAADGSQFTLVARLKPEAGGVSVEGTIRVVDPGRHPLTGTWRQVEEQICGTAGWRQPVRPIGELTFDADGRFSLTWQPFEAYRDYWGTYIHDPRVGSLRLEVTGGNRPPTARVTSGRAEIAAEGLLTLHGMTPDNGGAAMPACSIRLRRN